MVDETQSHPLSPEAIEAVLRGLDGDNAPSAFALNVPDCRIVREIHRGAQGVVYLGVQVSERRAVAVKVLLERGGVAEIARQRFMQEIWLVAKLNHPHIVTLHTSGETADGRMYFVMEYVPGMPLRAYVREHKLGLDATLRLFIDLCETVEELHARGIVHRDLKPSNVLVKTNGQLKLVDLGLASVLSTDIEAVLARPGDLLGTLAYMSPEQAEMSGGELDSRSDVYSIGVMLYEVFTGELPCSTKGAVDLVLQRIREIPPVLLRKAWTKERGLKIAAHAGDQDKSCPLGPELETIVQKSLAKERSQRYATAGELGADLCRYLCGDPIAPRAESLWEAGKSRAHRLVRQQPIITVLVMAAVCISACAVLSDVLGARWFPLDHAFEKRMAETLVQPLVAGPLEHVRVIGVSDSTEIEQLAKGLGYSDVSRNDFRSLRRLHGPLMTSLARSGCQAVLFDVNFRTESQDDAGMVEGIRQLKRAGIPVVVAVEAWWFGDRGLAALSSPIASEVRWGCSATRFDADAEWVIPLAAQRAGGDVLSSFSLESVAAFRHSLHPRRYELDASRMQVHVIPVDFSSSFHREWNFVDYVPISDVFVFDEKNKPDPKFLLIPGDSCAFLPVNMPNDEILQFASFDYAEVFSFSQEQLQHEFRNRLVLVGDLRSTAQDRFDHPDGRKLHGVYGHAAAIEMLLRSRYARLPSGRERWMGAFLGTCIGFGIVLATVARQRRRSIFLVVITAGIAGASWVIAHSWQQVYNPLFVIFPLWVSTLLFAMIYGVQNRSWSFRKELAL